MRIPRIYTPQPLAEHADIILEKDASRHTSLVLRLRKNDPLILFNGDGLEYAASVVFTRKQNMGVRTHASSACAPQPTLRIVLIQGIVKGERMDYLIQKSVELGVAALLPVFSERTMVRLNNERLTRRMQHWHKIIIGACEQSGRCCLPEMAMPAPLSTQIEKQVSTSLKLSLSPDADNILAELPQPENGITLLAGPEGGLSRDEMMLAERHAFTPVRLGPRVMRAETAALAAIAAIQTLWGDFASE